VARVRRALGGAKVGHAGTLDPDATGVLVICVGQATKIAAFLMEGIKEYRGVGRLGITTDSQDATGSVVAERPVAVGPDDVRREAVRLTGQLDQIPPMFSAVKVAGQRLYRLARRGMEVERQPRRVIVHSFEVVRIDLPEFEFVLRCSKGTYVRTLVHDLGEALGCGAHLAELVRRRQGTFALDSAVAWSVLGSGVAAEAVRDACVAPEAAVAFLPERLLPPGAELRKAGEIISRERVEGVGELVRLLSGNGVVRGVGRSTADGLRVVHWFPSGAPFGRGKRT
jgi:tRNA pseudouridine55 synthase